MRELKNGQEQARGFDNLDNLSSAEIDEQICLLERDLKEAITANEIVEQERLELQKKIIRLQLEKKDLEMTLSKSHANLKTLQADIRIAKSKYWAVKNEKR